MAEWSPQVLADIAGSDDLKIAPFREDGVTYGTLNWIWSVVVDGELYVRAWNGQRSRWYQAAMTQRAGRITAGGHTVEVDFAAADATVKDAVDAAYTRKYAGSPYLPPRLQSAPVPATVRIRPRGGRAETAWPPPDNPGRAFSRSV